MRKLHHTGYELIWRNTKDATITAQRIIIQYYNHINIVKLTTATERTYFPFSHN